MSEREASSDTKSVRIPCRNLRCRALEADSITGRLIEGMISLFHR